MSVFVCICVLDPIGHRRNGSLYCPQFYAAAVIFMIMIMGDPYPTEEDQTDRQAAEEQDEKGMHVWPTG